MNIRTTALSGIAAAMLLSGCSSGSLSPKHEEIYGPLGDYFEVVMREYKPKDGRLYIEFKRTQDGLPSPWTEGMGIGYSDNCIEPCFIAEFLDEDGNTVASKQTGIIWDRESINRLISLEPGETASIPFSMPGDKAVSFKIASTCEYHRPQETTVSSAADDTQDSAGWDQALDEYERYVDKYLSLYKKSLAGDLSAAAEYISFMQKAEALGDKLDQAEGSMTSAQLKRYMSITQKMAQGLL